MIALKPVDNLKFRSFSLQKEQKGWASNTNLKSDKKILHNKVEMGQSRVLVLEHKYLPAFIFEF